MAYYNKGELDLAISEFDQAIQRRPGYALAHLNRGVAYYDKGMYSEALSDLHQGQPDYPDDTQYSFYQGLVDYYTDHPIGAIQSFYIVLTRNPDYALLYNDWSRDFGGKGYLDRAISDFSRSDPALPQGPTDILYSRADLFNQG